MGQRSQIYISYTNEKKENVLVARYYSWNYGSRMISRARGLIEWLDNTKDGGILNSWFHGKISRIADVNFDLRDVVLSSDLIAECEDSPVEERRYYIFNQDNNDGKLFIKINTDGTISYAFTDWNNLYPMTAYEYMEWQNYYDEEDDGSNCKNNQTYIVNNAKLMNLVEIDDFINANYVNLPKAEIMG